LLDDGFYWSNFENLMEFIEFCLVCESFFLIGSIC
jgi:hypothetical protein